MQFQELEEEIEETKLKLICAEKLINGLGGEKVRWTELVQNLDETYDNIIGDVLLSSSVVAYLAPLYSLVPRSKLLVFDSELGGGGSTRPISGDGGADQLRGVPVIGGLPTDGTRGLEWRGSGRIWSDAYG